MSAPYPAADSHGPHETDNSHDFTAGTSTSAAVDLLINDTHGSSSNGSFRQRRVDDEDNHSEQSKREQETSRDRYDRERRRRNQELELGKEHRRISGVSSVGSQKMTNDTDGDADVDMKSPKSDYASANGNHRSKRRSKSRDSERFQRSRRDRERERDRDQDRDRRRDRHDDYRRSSRGGDFFRRSRQRSGSRTRSRSPYNHSHYRPTSRPRRDSRERGDRRSSRQQHPRRRSPSPRRRDHTPSEPPQSEDERDRRTIFVQQLAARLRTKELIAFCEKVGPVKEAQIVKDRVSGRSKGVGYVEFKDEESVPLAIQLTGQKLLGIPIIAQFTEAEKNRQAKTASTSEAGEAPQPRSGPAPFHRLYVGNIHFSINENDIQNVFEPFGELDFVQLQRDDQNRSRGYGFVQFRDPNQAREALEKMNGFNLAGRPIRVGLGNDKSADSRSQGQSRRPTGTYDRSGSFGSGANAIAPGVVAGNAFGGAGIGGGGGGGGGSIRDEKVASGASALDDADVGGVNFNNFSRDALMRKLARADEPASSALSPGANGNGVGGGATGAMPNMQPGTDVKPLPVHVNMASRCVLLRNMFNPAEEEGEEWVKELEDEVRAECEDKYGHVVHISVDPNTQGDIYLKFDRVTGGENAIKSLNGRFFGGRQISAQPVVDAVYRSLFSKAM